MNSHKRTFYCSSDDWYMARAYSDLPLTKEDSLNKISRWFVPPLITFVISAIGSIIYAHWLWMAGIFLVFPLALVCYQKSWSSVNQSLIDRYEFIAPTEKIPFVSINDNVLQGYLFTADGSVSHEINFSQVTSFIFIDHSYKLKQFTTPHFLNEKARRLGFKEIPEIWTDRSRTVLKIYVKDKALVGYRLAIPDSWYKDATLWNFINELEIRSDKQVDRSAANSVHFKNYIQQYTSPLRQ